MINSKIEWTDRTWNPVSGCTKVSQGCKNCYAERMHERFNGKGSFRKVTMHEDRLNMPLKWKKPSKIFVNSMSDLFHEDVSFDFINLVFFVMSQARQHTFQILTKRPQRLLDFLQYKKEIYHGITWWPSKNVWIGVSVENQETADERIPLLLQVPATVRFLSCEPLLGRVDLSNYLPAPGNQPLINWVICGGESGPNARPMHPLWAFSLRDQCFMHNIPFFFKQWGQFKPHGMPFRSHQHWVNKAQTWLSGWKRGKDVCIDTTGKPCLIGADMKNAEYPVWPMWSVGNKKAGNWLSGIQHQNFPCL